MKNTYTQQFHSFGPGLGFVVHRITLANRGGRFSAWFEKDGKLWDAEQITDGGSSRKPTAQAMAELAPVGLRYVGIA